MSKPFDLVGSIIAFEQGELDEEGVLALVAHLVRTGMAWSLQGCYGRLAMNYIDAGLIDREGNVL